MFSSHGGHLTNAMYHHGETLIKLTHTSLDSENCSLFVVRYVVFECFFFHNSNILEQARYLSLKKYLNELTVFNCLVSAGKVLQSLKTEGKKELLY